LKKRRKKICGSTDTATTRPCRTTIYPCPRHLPDGKRRPKKPTLRRLKLAQNVDRSKSIAQAARKSGFSESVVKSRIYDILKAHDVQEAIKDCREVARLNPIEETNELETAVDTKAINQVRAEFEADVEELIARAKDAGTLLTRQEATEKLKPLFAQLLGKAIFDAALDDIKVITKAEADFDAAVHEFILLAKNVGIMVTRNFAAGRLKPFLSGGSK
jgi:hypothetical protein